MSYGHLHTEATHTVQRSKNHIHKHGECRCHNHRTERYYKGYGLCLRCQKLAPIQTRTGR